MLSTIARSLSIPLQDAQFISRNWDEYTEEVMKFVRMTWQWSPDTAFRQANVLAVCGQAVTFRTEVVRGFQRLQNRKSAGVSFDVTALRSDTFRDVKGFYHMIQALAHTLDRGKRAVNGRVSDQDIIPQGTFDRFNKHCPRLIERIANNGNVFGLQAMYVPSDDESHRVRICEDLSKLCGWIETTRNKLIALRDGTDEETAQAVENARPAPAPVTASSNSSGSSAGASRPSPYAETMERLRQRGAQLRQTGERARELNEGAGDFLAAARAMNRRRRGSE